MLTAHRTSRRLGSTLLLAALACLTACEPVGGLHRRRPSLADHGDQELAATASTIGTEWVRQDGWAVAPPLDAADGATRVSALLTLISADAPLPALEARGDLSGLPVTDWLPLTSYFEDGEARVATVDLGLEVDGIELRVPERELEAIADLRFSGSDPALLEETAPATETGVTRSALRAELTGLGIVTREEWGARRGTCTTRDGVRRRISIHHTEGGAVDPARQLRGVQSYHQSKGWCDVGYHFLIGADGRVYEGRPVELLGAHVRDNNPGNLGIAFIGCFDRRECATPTTLTDAMIESAGRLVGTLGDLYGITISSSNVRGHRDQVSTTCPGDDLYARIVDIVAIGQRSRLGGDAPPPVVPDPPPTGPSVCRHSLGGVYAAGACSETYQCCDGAWHARSPGCGACTCTETNGAIGCTATSPTDPTPPPSDPAPSDPAPSDPAPTPAPSGPPAGASCAHSFGGSYANTACSASYQCCDGTWRARASGCGTCFCVEETGTSGCGLSSEPAPSPVPSGLPSAGLTLSGSEIPRAGLANATLRGALGLSTEPYGNVETFEGASFVRGRVSWFGGPRDTGVTTTETGAVSGERLRSLNSPLSPDAATLRSRPADYYYAAMRWSYSPNGTRWWRDARILVVNPATGAAVVVRPVDWGPNTSTRRVIDLSPQALSDLGLDTDGQALVSFAPAGTPLGRVR